MGQPAAVTLLPGPAWGVNRAQTLLRFPQKTMGRKGLQHWGRLNNRRTENKAALVSNREQHSMFLETIAQERECLKLMTRRRGVTQSGRQLKASSQHVALNSMKKGPSSHTPLEWKPGLKASTALPAGYHSDICRQSAEQPPRAFGPAHNWHHAKKSKFF